MNKLTRNIANDSGLPHEDVKIAIRAVRSAIDHSIVKGKIDSAIHTVEGVSIGDLTNEGLITVASTCSNLDYSKATRMVEALQVRITGLLNETSNVEIDGLGTYFKIRSDETVNSKSQLEFRPLPYPDIPS